MKRIFIILLISLLFGVIGWGLDSYIGWKFKYGNEQNVTYEKIFVTDLSSYEWYRRITVSILCTFSVLSYHFLSEKYRKAEKKLLMAETLVSERYTTIFNNAPTAISLVDINGILIDCNPMMEELLGYKKKEIIGKNFKTWIHPDYHSKGLSQLENIIAGRLVKYTEYVFKKNDGENIDVGVNCTSVRDENGNFVHTICFLRNIVEEKRYEESMKEITDELQHSNQELEQFAYAASHDLQEPLRVISNYCEMLRDKCKGCIREDDETKKWLSYTVEATERMRTLVKELLDFSRVGRKDKPFEMCDIADIIEYVKNDFNFLIKETGTIIILEDKMPTISCIEFRMKQLFRNLISNAIKFRGDKNPLINISVCEDDNNYLFCVKDNGIGIAPEYFDRIFGLFKRLYSREEYPGTGIGLALCKKIVETHDGKIWVDSEAGRGASFYFTISKKIGNI